MPDAPIPILGQSNGGPVVDTMADDSPVVINGMVMPVHRALTMLVSDIQRRVSATEDRLGRIEALLIELRDSLKEA